MASARFKLWHVFIAMIPIAAALACFRAGFLSSSFGQSVVAFLGTYVSVLVAAAWLASAAGYKKVAIGIWMYLLVTLCIILLVGLAALLSHYVGY